MTQQPISEMPLSGRYYPDDREGIEEARKNALKMAQEFEEERWEQIMALLDGFEDESRADKLAFYSAKEPGMVNAPEPVWDLVITGLKKYSQLKVQYPHLAQEIAMLAPWLTTIAGLGYLPGKEAMKYATEYRKLLREARQ